jgi:hypothetical protein
MHNWLKMKNTEPTAWTLRYGEVSVIHKYLGKNVYESIQELITIRLLLGTW